MSQGSMPLNLLLALLAKYTPQIVKMKEDQKFPSDPQSSYCTMLSTYHHRIFIRGVKQKEQMLKEAKFTVLPDFFAVISLYNQLL